MKLLKNVHVLENNRQVRKEILFDETGILKIAEQIDAETVAIYSVRGDKLICGGVFGRYPLLQVRAIDSRRGRAGHGGV